MKVAFNQHNEFKDYNLTIEFCVKNYKPLNISEVDSLFEFKTGNFTNQYANECFNEIKKLKYKWIEDFSFAGRSNGWFCLLCNKDVNKITEKQLHKIETIVNNYLINYPINCSEFYQK